MTHTEVWAEAGFRVKIVVTDALKAFVASVIVTT